MNDGKVGRRYEFPEPWYMRELKDADVKELAIHRRLSRVNYSRRCAALAVKAYSKEYPLLLAWRLVFSPTQF